MKMASEELAAKLQRRNIVIEADEEGRDVQLPSLQVFNPYTEFKEFSRKQIQQYQKMFNQWAKGVCKNGSPKGYDTGKDKFIDFMELKLMMEKLGCPQTHLALKEMIRMVDEDHDDKICFREFLLIFRKAAAGELAEDCGLYALYIQLEEIDVDKEGVKGAKNFFEAKIDQQTKANQFEQEIRNEQEEKKRQEEERKERRAQFKDKANFFQGLAS